MKSPCFCIFYQTFTPVAPRSIEKNIKISNFRTQDERVTERAEFERERETERASRDREIERDGES